MTLLLAHIDRECALLLSDRRLLDAATRKIADDDTTKTIWLPTRATAFAYTGLANLPPPPKPYASDLGPYTGERFIPVNIWFALVARRHLGEPLDRLLEAVAEQAAAAVRRLHYAVPNPNHRAIAFLGVSWVRFMEEGETPHMGPHSFEPSIWLVSNFHDSPDHTIPPQPEFQVLHRRIRRGKPWTGVISKPIPHTILRDLNRGIRGYYRKAGGVQPADVARLLVRGARATEAVDHSVGPGLLVTSVPRAAGEAARDSRTLTLDAAEPGLQRASFHYMPKDVTSVFHPILPTTVVPEDILLVDVAVGGLAPGAHALRIGADAEE